MKILFVVLGFISLCNSALAEDQAVGRYQLVSGIVEIVGRGSVTQTHVIIRIDTKTGRTWEYAAGVGKDGKMNEFWSPIPDKTLTGE